MTQDFQGQGRSLNVKDQRGQKHVPVHTYRVPFTENVHMQFGDCSPNKLGATGGTQFSRSRDHSSKITGANNSYSAHRTFVENMHTICRL